MRILKPGSETTEAFSYHVATQLLLCGVRAGSRYFNVYVCCIRCAVCRRIFSLIARAVLDRFRPTWCLLESGVHIQREDVPTQQGNHVSPSIISSMTVPDMHEKFDVLVQYRID